MIHLVGALGTVLVLGAYFLVSTRRIGSASRAFQGMNLVGAAALVVYAVALSAWANLVLNSVWAAIALVALLRLRRTAAPASTSRTPRPTATE
ncbi:MAG: hypothetical protein R2737_12465 [Candidatus Nanopelagicales bacterium]